MAFERTFLRPLYGRRDGGAYLLLTFGLAIVLSEIIRLIWGPSRSPPASPISCAALSLCWTSRFRSTGCF